MKGVQASLARLMDSYHPLRKEENQEKQSKEFTICNLIGWQKEVIKV